MNTPVKRVHAKHIIADKHFTKGYHIQAEIIPIRQFAFLPEFCKAVQKQN